MPTSYVTWNTQGNPLNDVTKQAALSHFIATYDFVLLQECGALSNYEQYGYAPPNHAQVCGGGHAGAFNNRCSTAILSRHGGGSSGSIYLQSGTGRSCITLELPDGSVVATLHAYSGDAAGVDRTGLLIELARHFSAAPFILVGGDWNMAPPGPTVTIGSSTRGTNWNISSSGTVTHPRSGTELDYFVWTGARIVAAAPVNLGQNGSDHCAVAMAFH